MKKYSVRTKNVKDENKMREGMNKEWKSNLTSKLRSYKCLEPIITHASREPRYLNISKEFSMANNSALQKNSGT
jgi:hypothetical protein